MNTKKIMPLLTGVLILISLIIGILKKETVVIYLSLAMCISYIIILLKDKYKKKSNDNE